MNIAASMLFFGTVAMGVGLFGIERLEIRNIKWNIFTSIATIWSIVALIFVVIIDATKTMY